VRDAAAAGDDAAIRAPQIRIGLDDQRASAGLQRYLKLEVLQPIGSFKTRACNLVRQPTPIDCSTRRRAR
jgi:threonine dehydratase